MGWAKVILGSVTFIFGGCEMALFEFLGVYFVHASPMIHRQTLIIITGDMGFVRG